MPGAALQVLQRRALIQLLLLRDLPSAAVPFSTEPWMMWRSVPCQYTATPCITTGVPSSGTRQIHIPKLPGKLVAIASSVRKALRSQFLTQRYRARQRWGGVPWGNGCAT